MKGLTKTTRAEAINRALNEALGHPVRGLILQFLDEREGCCAEVAEALNLSYHSVSNHMRKMAEPIGPGLPPLIDLVGTDMRRGGTMKIYKTISRPVIDDETWRELPQLLRELNSVHVGQLFIDEMIEAMKARTFDARADRAMVRTILVLDEEGYERMGSIVAHFLEQVQDLEAESCSRLVESEEKGINIVVGAVAFEKAPPTS